MLNKNPSTTSNAEHIVKCLFFQDGKLELVVLDYQILNVSNSVIDLMYFIFSGSDEEFRGKHYHQLLDYYHAELSASLDRLGVDPLTTYPKKDFDSDVKEVRYR